MARQGEIQISFVDNANRLSGESVGTGIGPAIEDELWISEVQEKIERALSAVPEQQLDSRLEREEKICKFTLGKEFCRPGVVTIGPYHRHQSTSITEKDKWLIVHLVNSLYNLDLADCLLTMKNQVTNALRCYSDSDISKSIDVKDEKGFAEILLLDSYFILFILTAVIRKKLIRPGRSLNPQVGGPNRQGRSLNPLDTMLNHLDRKLNRLLVIQKPDLSSEETIPFRVALRVVDIILQKDTIMLDLLILDNQIPFFVLEELFEKLKLKKKPLHKYALEFFEIIHPRSNKDLKGQNSAPRFFHLLDLFHWSRVPENKYDVVIASHRKIHSIHWERYTPTAMDLRESATRFEKKTSGSSLDITFWRGRFTSIIGVLNIPSLDIRDYSSFIFHNLIAFERQCPSRGRCAMAFSAFMRNLLRSEEDVKLLRRRGILATTSMTDSELVDFFKRLSRWTENYQMPIDLYVVYHHVLSHHNSRMSRVGGNAILQYFPNPLVAISVFAAAILFVLTILRTDHIYYARLLPQLNAPHIF